MISPPDNAPSIESLQQQIASLKAQIQALLNKNSNIPQQNQSSFTFTKDLYLGNIDPEVKLLQQFLNTHGFLVAVSGIGSFGKETTKFAYATQSALKRFQKSKHITPSGIFGPITRGAANDMLSK